MAGTYLVYSGVEGKPIENKKGVPMDPYFVWAGGQVLCELPFGVPVKVHDEFAVRNATARRWYKMPKGFKAALFSDSEYVRDAARGYTPKQHQFIFVLDDITDPRAKAVIAKSAQEQALKTLKEAIDTIKSYKGDTATLEEELKKATLESTKYERELKELAHVESIEPETAEEFVAQAEAQGLIDTEVLEANPTIKPEAKRPARPAVKFE